MSSESLPAVTAARFDALVLESDRPVVVDFASEWCPPCKLIAPLLADLSGELGIPVVSMNAGLAEAERAIAARYGVRGFPTLVGFRGGVPVAQHVGAASRETLRAFLLRVAA